MIIQTAASGAPRLVIMMHEHMVLSGQFARAFGNDMFELIEPLEPVVYAIAHHDAGWAEFDRDPVTDPATDLPYNLTDTPAEHITVTSRKSPDFNERHNAYSGLMSSMHSWGLYNGRYGLSDFVLIDKIQAKDRHLADRMLDGELARQKKLKAALAADPATAGWLDEAHVFQGYKQLQFCDTLALYFNRIHPEARVEQQFPHVPLDKSRDATVSIRPVRQGVYALDPWPFASKDPEFAFGGRHIEPGQQHKMGGSWRKVFAAAPTRWESFRLVPAGAA